MPTSPKTESALPAHDCVIWDEHTPSVYAFTDSFQTQTIPKKAGGVPRIFGGGGARSAKQANKPNRDWAKTAHIHPPGVNV